MDDRASAVIIPFPMTRLSAPGTTPAAPLLDGDRLSTALTALSLALAEQQQAVQRWREAIADLAVCMRRLGGDRAEAAPAR